MDLRSNRFGLYAWAGPGTIRLLQTKFFSPKINEKSFLSLYDLPYLQKAKDLFGITDVWVTYSWGFSDVIEQEDYEFLRSKLSNFKKVGIKTHAYIQGFNLVTNDFKDQDVFCRDPNDHLLPYSKGRSFTCPNNLKAVSIILNRVKKACQEDVDGIYIDNIMFGLPPLHVSKDFVSFFGCSCSYCQQKFEKEYGYPLPLYEKHGKEIQDYLEFRSQSVTRVLSQAKDICRIYHKEFGVNLYDPMQYTSQLYFGYTLSDIEPLLDYLLIENHSLPSQKHRSNIHLLPILSNTKKTVFVVSYNKGIGFEAEYSQHDIDSIFSESKKLQYSPCLKATEFTTRRIWHTLDIQKDTDPNDVELLKAQKHEIKHLKKSTKLVEIFFRVLQRYYAPLLSFLQNNRWANALYKSSGVYQHALHSFKNWKIK